MRTTEILQRLQNVQATGDGTWKATCPAHRDENASLTIKEGADGKTMLHCFAGCGTEAVVAALDLKMSDLFPETGRTPLAGSYKYGLTVKEYAEAKKFDSAKLAEFGVVDGTYTSRKGNSHPAVVMPYWLADGSQSAVRYRLRMSKETGNEPSRFLWGEGGKLCLYGLWRQDPARESVIVCEGESDCHALWSAGFMALGCPGAGNYKRERDDGVLNQYKRIYVHIERDDGGWTLFHRFAGFEQKDATPILGKCLFFSLPGYKDPSEAWQKLGAEEFSRLVGNAMRGAVPADMYQQPEAWRRKDDERAASRERKPDRRAETSAMNGQKGGRKASDYIGGAESIFDSIVIPGGPTLRYVKNQWIEWSEQDGCWHALDDADIENLVMAQIQNRDFLDAYNLQATTSCLRNLLMNIRSRKFCGLARQEMRMPCWIDSGRPADNLVVTKTGIVDAVAMGRLLYERGGHVTWDEARPYVFDKTPDLLTMNAVSYGFDPSAECPMFEQWLESTLPEEDKRMMFLMMMGLCLIPDTSYQVCFFLHGEGGTGKSTALKILTALVGERNTSHVPMLAMDNEFRPWKLTECLVNVVGEMPSSDPLGKLGYVEGIFKDIVEGAEISVAKKHENAVNARVIARQIFAMNTLPTFYDKSEGLWDRLRIIPFERRFRETAEQVKDYAGKIIASELPGVFNYALMALGKLMAEHDRHFPECESGRLEKEWHQQRCDFDRCYLEETYTYDPANNNNGIAVSEAYQHYVKRLNEYNLKLRSQPVFVDHVHRVFRIRPRKRGNGSAVRVFFGLMFKGDVKLPGASDF